MIPPTTIPCNKMCCVRRFVPLSLAWASTIHKAQGTEAGKTEPPRPPNPCCRIIVELGDMSDEKRNPGLTYVAMSRANSLGKGDIMESALYFKGKFTLDGLKKMTKKQGTNELIDKCKRRGNWIKHLEKNVHEGAELSKLEKKRLIQWAIDARLDEDHGLETFQNEICTWIPKT